jgi:outer membrane protein assembly factor BamB
MRHHTLRILSTVILLTVASTVTADTDPLDWPAWRGPHQNSVSDEVGLIDRFDPKGGEGSNLLWKSPAAAGISTPIVMGRRLYTIGRHAPGTPQDAEKVICLDAVTGDVLWENIYNVFLSDLPSERVGWSNVCGDPGTNRVYALGACCLLQCIDGESGKTLWSHSMSEEFGMLSTYGGRTNTPVVFEDLLIISGVTTGWDETARPAHRFFAFDKSSGELRWTTGTRPLPEDTTYSTPVVTVIGGQQVMLAGSGDGDLYAFQPRTGKVLWHQAISRRGINTTVVADANGNVYTTHGEENPAGTAMGAVVRIDGQVAAANPASAERFRVEELTVGKSSPLLIGDRLYVVEDSSRMHVLNAETGDLIGKPLKLGTSIRGSLLFADGKIYACTSSGIFHVLRPTDEGVESVFKVRLPSGEEVGGSPIASHGRIYLPTTGGLYCLGSNDSEAKAQPYSSLSSERPVGDDATMAHLQLIPAEAIVRTGAELTLKVAAFNSSGQRLDGVPEQLTFEVSGNGGTVDQKGTFVAVGQHQSAIVTVRSGDLVATSRLRVVPPLPWKFDFSAGEVPVTWIGARYRHEPRQVDGEPVIVKVSTIPKGTRSQTWMGPTDLHDYTVTADVKAAGGTSKLPDVGVIAQRYTLDMMGESQQLQIRTWAAQLRMARSVPFAWKADTWYTLKFRASLKDGVAVLQGKAWRRGTEEPVEWTVTATDESANLQGSPGLFGNATSDEIFIDNVTVSANQ